MDITCLKELWSEALCYKNCATEFVFILESEYELPGYMIDFDTFVRMNFRLEVQHHLEVIAQLKIDNITWYLIPSLPPSIGSDGGHQGGFGAVV